ELSNNSPADIIIYQVSVDNEDFSHTLVNTRIPRGQKASGTVTFAGQQSTGSQFGTLEILTDATDDTLAINLTATVTSDNSGGSDGGDSDGGGSGSSGGGGGSNHILLLSMLLLGALSRRGAARAVDRDPPDSK